MMKFVAIIPFLLVMIGCSKYEADIDALNTSRFEANYQGPSFIHVDSITTVPYGNSVFWQHRVHVSLDAELYSVPDHRVYAIEEGVQDTIYELGFDPSESRHVFINQNVQIGNEYCYDLQVLIDDRVLANHSIHICQIAEF